MIARAALATASIALLAGCAQRVIEVTTEPSGALVTINDVPVGRTPLQTEFTYYGDYDVQVRMDGYEPLRTKATAWTPLYERPPIDLVTAPVPYETVVKWHFKLEPSLERTEPKQEFEEGLITRAKGLRDQVDPPPAESSQTPPASSSPSTPVETAPPSPPPA